MESAAADEDEEGEAAAAAAPPTEEECSSSFQSFQVLYDFKLRLLHLQSAWAS
jgi:hypothetical protein